MLLSFSLSAHRLSLALGSRLLARRSSSFSSSSKTSTSSSETPSATGNLALLASASASSSGSGQGPEKAVDGFAGIYAGYRSDGAGTYTQEVSAHVPPTTHSSCRADLLPLRRAVGFRGRTSRRYTHSHVAVRCHFESTHPLRPPQHQRPRDERHGRLRRNHFDDPQSQQRRLGRYRQLCFACFGQDSRLHRHFGQRGDEQRWFKRDSVLLGRWRWSWVSRTCPFRGCAEAKAVIFLQNYHPYDLSDLELFVSLACARCIQPS